MNLIGPSLNREAECEAVLRTLPQWFGIEESLLMYAKGSASLPSFALEKNGRVIAFISLMQHFTASWEVHCIAVSATERGRGHGRNLLSHAQGWLKLQGAKFLQVKTIAESNSSPEYAQTRAFYLAHGFHALEVFPVLWHPRNPALQLIKVLDAGHHETSNLS